MTDGPGFIVNAAANKNVYYYIIAAVIIYSTYTYNIITVIVYTPISVHRVYK